MPRTLTRPSARKKATSRKPRVTKTVKAAARKGGPTPAVAARRLGKSLSRLARDGLSALSSPIELARSTVSRARKAARKK